MSEHRVLLSREVFEQVRSAVSMSITAYKLRGYTMLMKMSETALAASMETKAKTPADATTTAATKCLNVNDAAMWVTGWNDCILALQAQNLPLSVDEIDNIDQSMCGDRECVQPFSSAIGAAAVQKLIDAMAAHGSEPPPEPSPEPEATPVRTTYSQRLTPAQVRRLYKIAPWPSVTALTFLRLSV